MTATESIWRELGQALGDFFQRRVDDSALVDDLVQETMLRVHQGLPALRDGRRLHAWVYRIARRALADHYRQAPAETGGDAPEPGVAPEEQTLDQALGVCLRRMMASLPSKYSEALALVDVQGMSQAEYAAAANLSFSGAKSRVQRGREQLKALFLECCQLQLDRLGGPAGWRRREPEDCRDCAKS